MCTDLLLWLSHQKLDKPENGWFNFWNWGGNCPTPGCAPGTKRPKGFVCDAKATLMRREYRNNAPTTTGVRRGAKRACSPLEIGTKKQKFLENLKLAA